MRRLLLLILLLGTVSTRVSAAPLAYKDFTLWLDDEAGWYFGLLRAESMGPFFFSDGRPGEFSGVFEIASGPLVSLTRTSAPGTPDVWVYRYDPGTLTLRADWTLPDGRTGAGTFNATIPNFAFTVISPDDPTSCSDVCTHTSIDELMPFIDGEFDKSFARYLGVARYGAVGSAKLWAEMIDGDHTALWRSSNFNVPTANISADAPEPGAASLLLIGAALFTRRRCSKPGNRALESR